MIFALAGPSSQPKRRFRGQKGCYRGLASVALTPLTRPSEPMVDAACQAVSFDGYRAIDSRSDFKKAQRR
jgi:hypothetical protein